MPEKNSVLLVYSVTKESLVIQQNQKSALETKASTMTGFGGGMIALLMGATGTITSLPPLSRQMILTSIGLFLISILLATTVGWVRKYRTDPNPSTLAKNYLDKSEQEVQLQLIANLTTAWDDNFRQLESNAIILRIALIIQTLAFILLGIVLVFSISN